MCERLSANTALSTLVRIAPGTALGIVTFPVATVERRDIHLFDRSRIETASVDAYSVRVRSRDIERLYSALPAEQVFCDATVEPVFDEAVLPGYQFESLPRNDQRQVTRFRTNTAITFGYIDFRGSLYLEADPAAVTSAAVNQHRIIRHRAILLRLTG